MSDQQFDPEKENDAAIKKWEDDDACAKTLVRYNEYFKAKSRRDGIAPSVALFLGGALSLSFTKHRTHTLACGALSYIAAKQI